MPTKTTNVNVCWLSSTPSNPPGPVDHNVTFTVVTAVATPHPHGEFEVASGDSISFIPDKNCPNYKPFTISLAPNAEAVSDITTASPNKMPDGSVGATLTLTNVASGHEILAYMSLTGSLPAYQVAGGKPVIRNGPFEGLAGTGGGHFPGGESVCWAMLALLLLSLGYIGWSKTNSVKNSGG